MVEGLIHQGSRVVDALNARNLCGDSARRGWGFAGEVMGAPGRSGEGLDRRGAKPGV